MYSKYIDAAATVFRYTDDPCFHNGRIKIESGEQFVPLYLALLTTEYEMYLPPSPNNDETKKWLIKALQDGIPTEYTFIPYQSTWWPSSGQRIGIFNGSKDPNDMYHAVYESAGVKHTTTLGLHLTSWRYTGGVTVGTKNYVTTNLYKDISIAPELLVVVKAKHLPYIRACVLFQTPMSELPYTDIKLLRTPCINVEADTYVRDLLHNHDGIKVEYLQTEQIAEYLVRRREPKTKEQLLSDVVYMLDNNNYEDELV